MSCAVNCAPTVEKALRSLPGVRSATVDFETKTARVETEAGVELDTAAIDKSFDNQGYFVENLERLPAP
jgi:copper chaperone CopZ